MITLVLDFETYYDDEYSLRKMTPVEYILDPRFEVIGCAVKYVGQEPIWHTEQELRELLKVLPDKVTIISHNALFDMCILSWKFGYVPHLMIDTLGMARAWLGHKLKSLSLAMVSAHYGVGYKGNTVHQVKGMGLAAIKASGFYEAYCQYSCNDAVLCWQIYRKMVSEGYPVKEIAVMDTVLRACVKPRFVLDQTLLHEHLHTVKVAKQDLIYRCGLSSRDDLMSNEKFAQALIDMGVEPPRKISPTTGLETYAFAKTDPAFLELEEHEAPDVQALVAARMGVKSTIEETRTERLIKISQLTWSGNQQRLLPIPLRYSGAHTHRLSGDWKLNMQNLPKRENNKIRMAIKARPGEKVVTADASQVEARIAAWFCGAYGLQAQFEKGEDVYSTFASSVFGYAVTKANKMERFIGKTAVLGLQYGLGWVKFQKTVKLQSKAQLGQEVILDDAEATRIVNTYRQIYKAIPEMWKELDRMIAAMTGDCNIQLGPITFLREKILLPSGLYLHFHNLQRVDNEWWFTYGGKPKKIYGGKLLENIIQALARICVMDTAVRMRPICAALEDETWLNLQVHDELGYVVTDDNVEYMEKNLLEQMRVRPPWGLDIPLDAESGVGQSFGEA